MAGFQLKPVAVKNRLLQVEIFPASFKVAKKNHSKNWKNEGNIDN